jgi:hypothetical protein
MPPTKARPTATVAGVAASTPERGIPRTTHLRFVADYALRRAFETGQLDGTIDEFCSTAVEARLELVASGVLASDPEFQLAMYYSRRDKEDAALLHNASQAHAGFHSAKHHIGLYAKMRDKKRMAEFVSRRWTATEGIPIDFWREMNQAIFKDPDGLYWVAKGLHKLGYSLPATLISYLGL